MLPDITSNSIQKKYRLLENYRSEKFENSEYNVEIKTHCVHEDGVWQS